MNYKIAVCDDSDADRQYVSNLVRRWAYRGEHEIELREFSSAESFLFDFSDESDYDLLLLDIEMDGMDGVTMAKKVRAVSETVQIIFITGYSDYIADGYDVSALHYLMKPVDEGKLMSVLDRAAEKLAKNEKALCFETNDSIVRIPIYKIRYADVYGNYVTIHAAEDIKVRMTLGELAKELDQRFLRVGRSFIVNLTKISRVSKTEIKLTDGSSIPLPRGAYESVNRAIIDMR